MVPGFSSSMAPQGPHSPQPIILTTLFPNVKFPDPLSFLMCPPPKPPHPDCLDHDTAQAAGQGHESRSGQEATVPPPLAITLFSSPAFSA